MKSPLFALVSLAAVLVACGGVVVPGGTETPAPKPGEPCDTCTGGATLEARICPDGSAVGRTCLGRADGTCGYDFPACPSGGADGGSGSVDGAPPTAYTCTKGAPTCPSGLYCHFDPAAACGGTGYCLEKPRGCPENYDPVCGCDGKTYGNACDASAQGTSVATKGECPLADGAKCGTRGIRGQCAKGSFCQYALADACGAADAPGTCTEVPTVCGKNLAPVCGCDGKDYSNPCEAERASVSVASEGECP